MRTCGTPDLHERLVQAHRGYRSRRRASEANALQYARDGLDRLRQAPTVIKVVVHVVYNPDHPQTNISDEQINSQIDALNRDESLTRETVKPAFASLTIGSASAAVLLSLCRTSSA